MLDFCACLSSDRKCRVFAVACICLEWPRKKILLHQINVSDEREREKKMECNFAQANY